MLLDEMASLGIQHSVLDGCIQKLGGENKRKRVQKHQKGCSKPQENVKRSRILDSEADADDHHLGRNSPYASQCPRDLFELWKEYKSGLHGNTPAEQFTTAERNDPKVKGKYTRRKVVWECIERLIRKGCTANEAILKIYECYGKVTSVNTIIDVMLRDRKTGGHPDLK
mmetsp:Transcript_18178/g.44991  ORF Transcript_18178/g.44991 Transcript_18178/m.44991 type:complete len:169 (+) Transcript_18178:453-959(+)